MKVFGIGLSRTGTKSLTDALNFLGIPTVHFPEDAQTVSELAAFRNSNRDTLNLTILRRYTGATDTPMASVYRALDRGYPQSKFILTVRDQASWLASCERFWNTTVLPFVSKEANGPYVAWINRNVYGIEHFERTAFVRTYDQHCMGVRDYFARRPNDLLTLDIVGGQGWRELCAFVNRPVPRVPFPRHG